MQNYNLNLKRFKQQQCRKLHITNEKHQGQVVTAVKHKKNGLESPGPNKEQIFYSKWTVHQY